MCSVQDDSDNFPVQRKNDLNHDRSSSLGKKCMKCEDQAILVTRRNDAFCRKCFMFYVTHKFRAAIGKSRLVRDKEAVLVALSGGPSSSCLLNQIQEGYSERAHKKLRFTAGVIHIDETSTLNLSDEEKKEIKENMVQKLRDTGLPSYYSSLEKALKISGVQSDAKSDKAAEQLYWHIDDTEVLDDAVSTEETSRLKSVLEGFTSLSAKQAFLQTLRNQLLAAIAGQAGYTKVMVGDTGTRIAVRILSDIAEGRGSQVASDSAFADKRIPDLMVLRPLRDFSQKEVAMYNVINNVQSLFVPTLTTKMSSGSSIEHLTEAFVVGLQTDYLSTVSNIVRTGEKLQQELANEPEDCCAFCQSPLDTDVDDDSALSAVEFSENLSKKHPETDSEAVSHCGAGCENSQSQTTNRLDKQTLLACLCYGCRVVLKNVKDVDFSWPSYIKKEAETRKNRAQMKEAIEGFLLDADACH